MFWWVNQSEQYRYERAGNHVFAPATGGSASWANVGKLHEPDLLINYANKEIRAVAELLEAPSIGPRASVALDMKESHKPAIFEDQVAWDAFVTTISAQRWGRDEIEED